MNNIFGKFSLIIIFVFFSNLSYAEQLPSVLGLQFGMNRQQAEKLFKSKGIQLLGEQSYPGQSYSIVYPKPLVNVDSSGINLLLFYQDRLAKVTLLFDIKSVEPSASSYTSHFEKIEKLLIGKYGAPEQQRKVMDSFYDNSEYRLLGFKTGEGAYLTVWDWGGLYLSLVLKGDNYEIDYSLSYEYSPLFEEFLKSKSKIDKDVL